MKRAVRRVGDDPRQRRLAGAGRAPEDDRLQDVGVDGLAQRPARGEQAILADNLVERARPHPLGERRPRRRGVGGCGGGRGRRRTAKSLRVAYPFSRPPGGRARAIGRRRRRYSGATASARSAASARQCRRAPRRVTPGLGDGVGAGWARCRRAQAIATILRRTAELLEAKREALAELIARESGKAWRYADAEVARAVETFEFAAEEAKRLHGETVPLDASAAGEGRMGFYLRVPVGVVAAITPFNFPLNLVAHKVAPALAAGNTVVLKPADRTPLTAVRAGPHARRRRAAGRRARSRARRRRHDRRGAGAPSGAGQDLVHRQPGGGGAHPGHRRPQARDAGARQQLGRDDRARRRPRQGDPARW